ncbi:MAG: CsgG/HfaB family protein [Ignavibacteriales bacterium]|nr:CsgG/HfaB family protein [Ignavibacteriales bacterium]MCF8316185.1 CsgG/HfaB family protein [Ignavibacteriales bacterium]MCF8436687.1 CsgG/HfaB family protein [Ignavibacteriales bacterium]
MKRGFTLVLILIISLSLFAQDRKQLLVGPFTNGLDDEKWNDPVFGFGLRSVLAQVFYETGYFVMVEEKEEIREQLAKALERAWLNDADIEETEEQILAIANVSPDLTAYADLVFFGRPKSKLRVGVFHSDTKGTVIRIEVFLKDRKTGTIYSALGEGTSETTAVSAIFEANERKIVFDKSTLGIASREAISKAVEVIMDEYTGQ